jgi:hypothetical protein
MVAETADKLNKSKKTKVIRCLGLSMGAIIDIGLI